MLDQPIGVIDSGVGGLTVAKEIMSSCRKKKLYILETRKGVHTDRGTEKKSCHIHGK